jgi:hypothetical protein
MVNKGRMIYLPEDLNTLIRKVNRDIGIKSPAEAIRLLIKQSKRIEEGELNFKL